VIVPKAECSIPSPIWEQWQSLWSSVQPTTWRFGIRAIVVDNSIEDVTRSTVLRPTIPANVEVCPELWHKFARSSVVWSGVEQCEHFWAKAMTMAMLSRVPSSRASIVIIFFQAT
jgi:hypothetical protein